MWIFTRYGFFSIASAHKDGGQGQIDPNEMMIRARSRRHLEALKDRFGLAGSILESKHSDYRYRLLASKSSVAQLVSELVLEQEWSNFKDEALRVERSMGHTGDYVDALHQIWHLMYRLQIKSGRETIEKSNMSGQEARRKGWQNARS
jgi:hypothetical protein